MWLSAQCSVMYVTQGSGAGAANRRKMPITTREPDVQAERSRVNAVADHARDGERRARHQHSGAPAQACTGKQQQRHAAAGNDFGVSVRQDWRVSGEDRGMWCG